MKTTECKQCLMFSVSERYWQKLRMTALGAPLLLMLNPIEFSSSFCEDSSVNCIQSLQRLRGRRLPTLLTCHLSRPPTSNWGRKPGLRLSIGSGSFSVESHPPTAALSPGVQLPAPIPPSFTTSASGDPPPPGRAALATSEEVVTRRGRPWPSHARALGAKKEELRLLERKHRDRKPSCAPERISTMESA
uniref:Uncharacterized protein n=1 Tax=Sphaerodactylus townsendi TaxID=933632 RepID=A0ACB8FV44_9SAUR